MLYNFDTGGHALKPEHRSFLAEKIAPRMRTGRWYLWLCGTASKIGSASFNEELSQRRVEQVVGHLSSMGVSAKNIQVKWTGERESMSTLADDETERAVQFHMQRAPAVDKPAPEPPPVPPPPPPKPAPSGRWFGIGYKFGGHVIFGGSDYTEAAIWSYDNFSHGFTLAARTWRLGPGLGASGGAVLVLISGLTNPYRIIGHRCSGGDFQANLGTKWGALAKFATRWQHIARVARKAATVRSYVNSDTWQLMLDGVKNLYSVFGHPPNSSSLEVTIADWPGLGGGLEASAYKGWTDCNAADVEWDADE
jgi:hypothetical protein